MSETKTLISLVGRPNVGKSSLFNALLKKRSALVMDFEGVTRDRRFGTAEVEALKNRKVRVCDTGGWMPEQWRKSREDREMLENIERQIQKALAESSVIILVMDIREGPTSLDQEIVRHIRKLNIPFVIAANKADQFGQTYQLAEFYSLGAEAVIPVSAEHKQGLEEFWLTVEPFLPPAPGMAIEEKAPFRICIVGRPNVGKSSLLNHLVQEVRSVASAMPGTTTDPVDVEITREGERFLLIDTAGIRRHAKRKDDVEDLGVMYATRALDQADLAFLVLDAEQGITSQDSRIAKLVEESGCACIVLANKWDLAPHTVKSESGESVKKYRELIDKEWSFLDFAPLVAISAEKEKIYGAAPGTDALEPTEAWPLPRRIDDLWAFALYILAQRERDISPEELTEVVKESFAVGPNWVEGLGDFRRLHQVGHRPPQFMAFVRNSNDIPEALRRYLKRSMKERYGFRGHPVRWIFRHRGEKS